MKQWTKSPYGKYYDAETDTWHSMGGHWTITDGRLSFDVHILIDGGGRKAEYPDGSIVSTEQADQYAKKIIEALNKCEVSI